MKSKHILVLGIVWMLASLLWFFVTRNTAMGFIWLGGGAIEVIIAMIRLNREKKANKRPIKESKMWAVTELEQ